MSTFVFANNVNTTLAAGINSTATTITLTSSANLPTLAAGDIFAMTFNDAATQSVFEVVYVTAISGATLTVVRGQENSAAQSWLTGDYAYGSNTKGILESFVQTGSEPGSGFVTLNPPAQQSGSIDVSGTLNLGAGNATTAGDGGFGRSASTGAISLGGSSASVEIDFGLTTAGVTTFDAPVQAPASGSSVSAPLAPAYTATGSAAPGTMKIVMGTFATTISNPATSATNTDVGSVAITLSGAAVFSSVTSYTIHATWQQASYSGASFAVSSVTGTPLSKDNFEISVYGNTGSNTTNVIVTGVYTLIGY